MGGAGSSEYVGATSATPDESLGHSLDVPTASVVIPTFNRRESLRGVLDALARQTTAPGVFEVLVICDGCTDGTDRMCRSMAQDLPFALHILIQSRQGPAAARNLGVAAALAPLILFIDDDVVPDATLISRHLELHAADDLTVVIGPLLNPPDVRLKPWVRWESSMLSKQYTSMTAGGRRPTPRQFYTGNASVCRAHVLAAGGFDARLLRAEDVDLAYRLGDRGLRFHFAPDARGWHYACRSLHAWLSIPIAYGVADCIMYRDGRLTILQNMGREFHRRRLPLRWLGACCVGRPVVARLAVGALVPVALAFSATHLNCAAGAAYSAIYNLRYWQSVSQELGSRRAFWALVRDNRQAIGD